jgi:hypothetical protein
MPHAATNPSLYTATQQILIVPESFPWAEHPGAVLIIPIGRPHFHFIVMLPTKQ